MTTTVVMWGKKENLLVVFLVKLGVFFLKFLNPACSVNQFLFTGKKGVAGRTDFNLHLLVHRAQFNFIAACADSCYFMIFWMNIWFHGCTSTYCPP